MPHFILGDTELEEIDDSIEGGSTKKNIQVLLAQSVIDGFGANMLNIVWQPFVLTLNLSMAFLGGISSIYWLTTTLVQPLAGKIADIYGRKRHLILGSILLSFALLLYAVATSWFS